MHFSSWGAFLHSTLSNILVIEKFHRLLSYSNYTNYTYNISLDYRK